jgi:hypothetical protein
MRSSRSTPSNPNHIGPPKKRGYEGGTALIPTATSNQRWSSAMNLEFWPFTTAPSAIASGRKSPRSKSKPSPMPSRSSPTCTKSKPA